MNDSTASFNTRNVFSFEEPQNNIKFIATTVWIDWGIKNNGEMLKKQCAVICLKDDIKGTEVIHPISDFILSNWGLLTYNTQRKHAINTIVFLNFLLKNRRRLGIKTLDQITIPHGNSFLNSLTKEGKARKTVKDTERTLTNLYVFLKRAGCLPNVHESKIVKKQNEHGKWYYESLFNPLYPEPSVSNLEHVFPLKHIPLLFEIAILVAPRITLGIYLQMFGGLRVGEVVNLKRSSAKKRVKDGDLLFKLKTRNMRTDIKDSSGSTYVKRPRNQRVYNINDWLEILFDDHIAMYKDVDKSGALFVNSNGKAMTGKSYRQYFDKVKRYFIKFLREQGNPDDILVANHLSIIKWSTHIGRGTFTNILAEDAENPYDIAFPRGDKQLASSLSYMSKTERMRKKIEERFQHMHNEYIPRLVKTRKGDHGGYNGI